MGLSNPSYNREGFRILFPGAAASGPSPSKPAFPSPGSLWGVTFCSILTAERRRCSAARSPGGLGSVHRRAQHTPGSGATASPRAGADAASCAALRATRRLGALRGRGGGRKMAAAPGGHRERRPRAPSGGPDPRLRPLPAPRGASSCRGRQRGPPRVPLGLRGRRMGTVRGFREPPPPSLKSSRGRSRGVDRLRGLGGARERGASGASMGSALCAASGHGPRRRPFPGGWTRIVLAARGA